MRIGFTGAHRTGKSTLAQFINQEWGLPWVQSPAGKIVKDFGFDMGRDNRLSFERVEEAGGLHTGVDMQWAIYDTLVSSLQEAPEGGYVSDRTPIDCAAYMMADATGYAGEARAQSEAVRMMERAIVDTERLFDGVILVQPGIAFEGDPNKPPFNDAYQEHHGLLCRGMLFDDDLDLYWDEIARDCIDLDDRKEYVRGFVAELTGEELKVAA